MPPSTEETQPLNDDGDSEVGDSLSKSGGAIDVYRDETLADWILSGETQAVDGDGDDEVETQVVGGNGDDRVLGDEADPVALTYDEGRSKEDYVSSELLQNEGSCKSNNGSARSFAAVRTASLWASGLAVAQRNPSEADNVELKASSINGDHNNNQGLQGANIMTAVLKQPAQNANITTFPRKQPGVQHNFTSTTTFHFGNINQQQSVGSQTFWTMCPACCMKFQYFRNLLNRSIRCYRCLQPFVATELNEQSVPRPWESSNLHTHTQNSKQEFPFQGSNFGNFSFPTGFQGNVAGGSSSGVKMDRGGKKENDMETTGSKGVSVDGLNGDSLKEDNSVPADEYLEPEFYAFDGDKTIEKFQPGQIWAVYSDIDQYPKFYVMIKNVDGDDITVSRVELSPRGKDEEKWIEKTLPATCGRFKVERATNETFDTAHFSHMVQAEDRKKWEYDIYPRTGQVWALYKDWNMGWSEEDLSKCEYHVAEIIEVTGSVVKVLLLTKVADYNWVFKPEEKGGVEQVMEIPLSENLRFSHQIPAFQLTDEADGSLRGYWELDSASVPKPYI